MIEGEPPPAGFSKFSLLLVGRNGRGNWVVQDPRGLCGGFFRDRTEALKFARAEKGDKAQAVIIVPGVPELDISPVIAPRSPSREHHACEKAA
jgi:hypothetical protein